MNRHQLLSSLVGTSLVDDADLSDPGRGPRVHRQSLLRLRRPATGVSGAESLSSDDEESRFSPVRGDFVGSELSEARVELDLSRDRDSERGDGVA
jgi:hypothetical protein